MTKLDGIREVLLKESGEWYSSEALFDISDPPDFMCDEFAKAVNFIELTEKEINKGLKGDDEDDFLDALERAEYELSGTSSIVEDLNAEVEKLRDWGQEWKDLAKQLIEDNHIDLSQYSLKYESYKNSDAYQETLNKDINKIFV